MNTPHTPGSQPATAVQAITDAPLELLKAKYEEGANLLTHYIRAFALYVVATGGLLKFALDAQSTKPLFVAMSSFGLAMAILGMFAAWFADRLRRSIRNDINTLSEHLKAPPLQSNLEPLRYMLLTAVPFIVFTLGAWCFLLASGPSAMAAPATSVAAPCK